jgi:hypothetical protein
VGVGARRPEVHAGGQWLADDLPAHHDPGLAGHRLDLFGCVRGRVSLWALVSGHWSTRQAAPIGGKQDEAEPSPVADRMVEKLVEDTIIDPLAQGASD